MKSKVSELGVFAMGVGVLVIAMTLYVQYMLAERRSDASAKSLLFVLTPFVVLFIAGLLTVIVRNAATIVFTMIAVTLSFGADALLSGGPIKLAFAAGCIWLTISTGLKALKEIQSSDAEREVEGAV